MSQEKEILHGEYAITESVSAATVTEIQKQQIIEVVLCAIRNTTYYKGIELDACNAVSAINRYSDAEIKREL